MQSGDPTISFVEDLDLDPTSPPRRVDRRELLLGCLLLVLVLGWAGWQWWQQDGKERSYRLGEQAEQEHRWAAARAEYLAASGYRDATDRAASVTKVINALQDNFVSARWYAQGGNWVAALRAVQALYAIDSHYGDATSLGVEANRHVYRDALLGAIAVRPQAQPPGLYYRSEVSWVWLEGSDQWSSVRSFLSSGAVVYDVPAVKRSNQPTPAPASSLDLRQGAEWLKGRSVVAASLDSGKPYYIHLAFDPAIYDYYLAGSRGVWGVRKVADDAPEQALRGYPALRETLAFPSRQDVDYQSLGSTVSSTVRLLGAEWVILNADVARDRLLLADVKEQRGDGAAIDLYLSDAQGGNRRLLYSHEGALGSTQFSPDGRYVLLSIYSSLGSWQMESLSLVLLDVEQVARPVTLSEKIVAASALGSSPLPQMRAAFLTKGKEAGMLLVVEWGAEQGDLSIYNPANPGRPMMRAEIPGGLAGKAWVNEEDDGAEPIVAWQPWLDVFSPRGATLVVAKMGPGRKAAMETFTLDRESDPVSVVLRGNYLICAAYRGSEIALYDLPLPGPGKEQAQAINVYAASVPVEANPFLLGFPWRFGPQLLSYTDNGQLHARAYDGVIDVPLESGVTSFFNFDWASPIPLLR